MPLKREDSCLDGCVKLIDGVVEFLKQCMILFALPQSDIVKKSEGRHSVTSLHELFTAMKRHEEVRSIITTLKTTEKYYLYWHVQM